MLTSVQCVDPSIVGAGATIVVFTGSDLNDGAQVGPAFYANVASVDVEPGFDQLAPQNGHDIGVVVVESALKMTPVAINRSALAQADVGGAARMVGFGDADPNLTNGTIIGVRRRVSTTITAITADFVTTGDATHGTCNGDSGGPVLMTRGGQEVVVGITSFGSPNCDGPSSATNLDKYVSTFIDPRIIAADGEIPMDTNDLGARSSRDAGTTGQSGGCSMSSSPSRGDGWIFLLIVAAFVARRRVVG